MDLRFALDVSSMVLYNERRSWYLSVRIGRRTWYLTRWDTARVSPRRLEFRGPDMTWYAGVFRAGTRRLSHDH